MMATGDRRTDLDITTVDSITGTNAAKFVCVVYLGRLNASTNQNKAIVKVVKLINEELKQLTI